MTQLQLHVTELIAIKQMLARDLERLGFSRRADQPDVQLPAVVRVNQGASAANGSKGGARGRLKICARKLRVCRDVVALNCLLLRVVVD